MAAPTFRQYVYNRGTSSVTFPAPTLSGNLLILAVTPNGGGGGAMGTPAGWTREVNDEISPDSCYVFWKVSTGEQTVVIDNNGIFVAGEYAGLPGPVLIAPHASNLENLGVANLPLTAYNKGPQAVIGICFEGDGPTGTDNSSVDGPATERNPIAGGDHPSKEIVLSDYLLDASSAGSIGWRFLFTGGSPTRAIGMTFQGTPRPIMLDALGGIL